MFVFFAIEHAARSFPYHATFKTRQRTCAVPASTMKAAKLDHDDRTTVFVAPYNKTAVKIVPQKLRL